MVAKSAIANIVVIPLLITSITNKESEPGWGNQPKSNSLRTMGIFTKTTTNKAQPIKVGFLSKRAVRKGTKSTENIKPLS